MAESCVSTCVSTVSVTMAGSCVSTFDDRATFVTSKRASQCSTKKKQRQQMRAFEVRTIV